MAETVDIFFSSKFGTRGTGNGEFDYPTGMVWADDKLFVVDRQNHRVQYFDLAGAYIGQFGSEGTGNSQFRYPEGITATATYLYICDNSNHRIVIYDFTGAWVGSFGSEGIGDTQFKYPTGITTDDTYLYICDKQNNRVKKHTAASGLYVDHVTGLSFPEGVAIINDKLAVIDSANDLLKFYDLDLLLLSTISDLGFIQAVRVANTNGVLTITDRGAGKLIITDAEGALIDTYGSSGGDNDQLSFPVGVAYNNNILYVCETYGTAYHRVKIYGYTVNTGLNFLEKIINLKKQLYPTGRAWWMPKDGLFDQTNEALARSDSRMYTDVINIQNSILADNDLFDEADAVRWETVFGLIGAGTLEQRKSAILQRQGYPNNVLARQHYTFMQDQLQAAGFDVYVQENRFPDGVGGWEVIDPDILGAYDWQLGLIELGPWELGGTMSGVNYTQLAANFLDADLDATFFNSIIGEPYLTQLRATFFIGGPGFPSMANVDEVREREFRDLIFKLKPAQTVGFLYITYT